MASQVDILAKFYRMMNQGAAETFDPATDSLEAIANALGIGPSVGLWMFGVCDPAMVASTVNIFTNNLVGLPDDIFNDEFWMQVIHNDNAPGVAPEREVRRITDFISATQQFVVDAFSVNVEADDLVCIFHESLLSMEVLAFGTLDTDSTTVPADSTRAALYAWENNDYFKGAALMPTEGACRFQPRPIASFAVAGGVFTLDEPFTQLPGLVDYVVVRSGYPVTRLTAIFNLISAMLVTTETGGSLTTTGPGTEDNVYINNAPAGIYEPLMVQIDFTNQLVTDTARVRVYYRITPGGGLLMKDELVFAGVQVPVLKNIPLEPNRYGIQVTIETIAGAATIYPWNVVYRG